MVAIDPEAPLRFLRTAYEPGDWIAILLKPQTIGAVRQRVAPVDLVASTRVQAWLRAANAARHSIYVSVNVVQPGQRSRRREAVHVIRHIVIDVDCNAPEVLGEIEMRPEVPAPSYVLHTSSDRVHVLWRVSGFAIKTAERLQKHLARELRADPAATSCAQMTRLPGFFNYRHVPATLVAAEYRNTGPTYTPSDFPDVEYVVAKPRDGRYAMPASDRAERARRYLAAVPPAIQGQHGDSHTFRISCRLVRGFALTDADAMRLLAEWNERCQPPWSEDELRDKLEHARRYGREPIGGLLDGAL